jgi:hypothetical protein
MSKQLEVKISRRHFIGSSLGVAGGLLLYQSALATTKGVGESTTVYSSLSPPRRANVKQVIEGDKRVFYSSGAPDHSTGPFPSPTCPYGIGNRPFRVQIPLFPQKQLWESVPIEYWRFGIAVNGVVFDPAGPALENGWQFEVLSFKARRYLGIDHNNAHVQPYDGPGQETLKYGQYHYHGFPYDLYGNMMRQDKLVGVRRAMYLLGYAADGFPIYAPNVPADPGNLGSGRKIMHSSYRLKKGIRKLGGDFSAPEGKYDGTFVQDYEYVEGLGDLDECNGREGVTPEYPHGIYHYIATEEFPFIPRRFRGVPDESLNHPVGPGPGQIPPELLEF